MFPETIIHNSFETNSITTQKMKFSIKDFFCKYEQMVTFTGEILDGKLHCLCSVAFMWNISSFNVWSLQINFASVTRVLVVYKFTCTGWFDEKWVYWPLWVGFLYTFVIISLFPFKFMMQSRSGKFPSDAFSIVNSNFSSIPFTFCNVSPRSCDLISKVFSA